MAQEADVSSQNKNLLKFKRILICPNLLEIPWAKDITSNRVNSFNVCTDVYHLLLLSLLLY